MTQSAVQSGNAAGVQRLFFALWPDAVTRAQLACAADMLRLRHGKAGRWTSVERYHLTLQFLGEFAAKPAEIIDVACAAAAQVRASPFAFALDRAASFRNRPAPWWLGCSEVSSFLSDLWEQLGGALRAAEVPFDAHRAFVPHLTILRDAQEHLPDTMIEPVRWPVPDFVLMQSHFGSAQGYSVLRQFPLRA